jgi:hypothetical protein
MCWASSTPRLTRSSGSAMDWGGAGAVYFRFLRAGIEASDWIGDAA